jgi:hypothetical protein
MFVPLLAVPLAVQLIAVSDGVPAFDVTPSCKGAVQAGYIGPEQSRLQNCLDSEQRTRDKLDKEWTTFPAGDRVLCIASVKGFSPTYTELATCLEMKRDLRTMKPVDDLSPARPAPRR